MRWWDFEEGKQYDLEEVVSKVRAHIQNSGQVKDQKRKLKQLEKIENCGHSKVKYVPTKERWGVSPMNPNCWVTIKGAPII